jgi:enamine deaminase RidA (YjgF/YER057c/UK114 family)
VPIERHSSGTPYEAAVGYSRAVRAGDMVYVAGCTAINQDGIVLGPGDVYAQAVQTLRNVEAGLALAGARLDQVVRSRVYVTDISQSAALARAHREVFGEIRPANVLVEVSALADPLMLVEIEVDAYLGE